MSRAKRVIFRTIRPYGQCPTTMTRLRPARLTNPIGWSDDMEHSPVGRGLAPAVSILEVRQFQRKINEKPASTDAGQRFTFGLSVRPRR